MPTLLDISEEMAELDRLLADAAGDDGDIGPADDVLSAWFAELSAKHEHKLDAYAALISELELRAEARKKESERLARRAKIDQAHADFLRDRLKRHFEEHRIQKVETDRFRISLVNNGGKVPVLLSDEPERFPAQFQRVITTIAADTDAIRTWLEAGDELPFASLGSRGTQLRIR